MAEYGRIIGIDVGTKWIGLARTDLLKTVANPIGTYYVDDVFEALEEQVENENVEKIVVGWPLTPEGEEGRAIKMVEEFLAKLEARFPDIEVAKIDERYTTKEAVRAMVEAGVPKMKRRESDRVNQAAAAIILQKYIELVKADNVRITDRYI
ncbi:Holliday junction resolvase RuvX [Aliifodinibius salipaludis]|uniref:Putative pre-16S rRNA nuclease n=1 Tax=Fodinibius salipaludis TaxID=2032627 RepID=A0A2A2G7F8_9BACT|nr:Holliday junction resolvase RuvX [Aliifodinibius salipaludis]PAU93686.1 Holliday junction resolvase RuvX [Aliifodinibius salipaludis]